eukprot:236730_1
MPQPASKKRKLNRHITARANADNLLATDKYDVESWMHIISRSDKEGNLEDQRHILNLFLEIFPTSARQWKYYIEIEMHNENYSIATDLFKKCINNKCYDVELYLVYIALCRKINETSNISRDIYLKNLNEAYKFAIKQIGQDIKSTSLWRSYLNFLKSNSSQLSSKHNISDITLEIRNIYHSLIKLPIEDCDKLWDEYIQWESSLNTQLASAYHDKFKHLHESTKLIYLERKRWRRGILLYIHTVPSNNQHAQERNYQQIQLWKRFIDFELLNKQNINKIDLWRRMEFTFRQSLMTMSLFPDIWLMYIEWTKKNRGKDRTLLIYKQCLQRIPNCLLIQFKYLEFLEKHYTVKETDEAYLNLLNVMPNNTLVYIQYLYFLRRCKTIPAARNFFIQTISSNTCKFWQLYVAEGYIEEYMNNDSACAARIFQNGFKYFKDAPEFVICYCEFLMNKKDENSKNELQQIFEHILPQLNPKNISTKEIWKLYIKFNRRQSDLNALHLVENRRNNEQHCNRIEILLNSISRFTFLDLLPVSKQYRDTLIHAKQTSQRKQSQKLNQKLQSMNIINPAIINNIKQIKQKNYLTQSKIKINVFKNKYIENNQFIDMTGFIDDNGEIIHDNITMPNMKELLAFRPGVRFLQRINDDNDNDNENENENDDNENENEIKLTDSLPPKIKELLDKLPPPQHTQLLKLDKIKNTLMIDIDAFITFMK